MTLIHVHGCVLHIWRLDHLMIFGRRLGQATPTFCRSCLRLLEVERRVLWRLRGHEVVHAALLLGATRVVRRTQRRLGLVGGRSDRTLRAFAAWIYI